MGGGMSGSAEQAMLWSGASGLRTHARADGTWGNIRVAVNAWSSYRDFIGASPWLPSARPGSTEDRLNCAHGECFIFFLLSRIGISCAATCFAYLAGAGTAHEYQGLRHPWARKDRLLKDVIAAAKRLYPSGSKVADVMTVPIVRQLFTTEHFDGTTRFSRMLRLAVLMCLFGMFRSQDIVVKSSVCFDPTIGLSKADVTMSIVSGK